MLIHLLTCKIIATKRRMNDSGECASKKKKIEDSIVEEVIQSLGYESPRPEQEAVMSQSF